VDTSSDLIVAEALLVRITIRHHFDFGLDREIVGHDLVRPEAWDALRMRTSGPFAIARDRAELERMADEHRDVAERVRRIDSWLRHRRVGALASYGVGGAVVEFGLHRLTPERVLRVTDYAPATVARVRTLLPEAEVECHDLLRDPPLDADLHLFHRIDSELANGEWRRVFERFATVPILVVATEVADLGRLVAEIQMCLRRRGVTRAGWLRTRGAFQALWRKTHRGTPLRFHDLEAWSLEPRGPNCTPRASKQDQGA
jgi:hypothetical protein